MYRRQHRAVFGYYPPDRTMNVAVQHMVKVGKLAHLLSITEDQYVKKAMMVHKAKIEPLPPRIRRSATFKPQSLSSPSYFESVKQSVKIDIDDGAIYGESRSLDYYADLVNRNEHTLGDHVFSSVYAGNISWGNIFRTAKIEMNYRKFLMLDHDDLPHALASYARAKQFVRQFRQIDQAMPDRVSVEIDVDWPDLIPVLRTAALHRWPKIARPVFVSGVTANFTSPAVLL